MLVLHVCARFCSNFTFRWIGRGGSPQWSHAAWQFRLSWHSGRTVLYARWSTTIFVFHVGARFCNHFIARWIGRGGPPERSHAAWQFRLLWHSGRTVLCARLSTTIFVLHVCARFCNHFIVMWIGRGGSELSHAAWLFRLSWHSQRTVLYARWSTTIFLLHVGA